MDKSETSDESAEETSSAEDTPEEESSYIIRPSFEEKFNPTVVKSVIKGILIDKLGGRKYNSFDVKEMSQHLARCITEKLCAMPYQRYKYIVEVCFAEHKGQGMEMACKSFWDSDTDNTAFEYLKTEYLTCCVSASAVYYY